ncbi:MAG: hypothetical protein NTY03_04325 [Candidatus Bathyarchaeota archaeon]|nr:hypothetical protein [Candidatus Bathyarchaeota archaeon]
MGWQKGKSRKTAEPESVEPEVPTSELEVPITEPEVEPELPQIQDLPAPKPRTKGCFIVEDDDDDDDEEEYPQDKLEKPIAQDTYEMAKKRTSYREVEHKEAHELGAVLSNLDSKYFLDMNTEMVDEAISDFAIVQGMVKAKIYSPWIGELLDSIKALSISSGRKGRIEKRDMTIGARKQRGLQGWGDAVKQHPPTGQGEEQ